MKIVFSFLLVIWILQLSSITYAQAEDCSEAQTGFVAAMEQFRTAYFEREDAVGSAESVMADQVRPNAEKMYQLCPANTAAAIKAGVERANASLSAPNRLGLVQCDKALVTYNKSLNTFDSLGINNYHTARDYLKGNVDSSAKAAVDACPQMPDLAQQTIGEVTDRQRRLDRMEDLENRGPSMADNIDTNNEIFSDSLEED